MQKGSTILLRVAVLGMGVAVLSVSIAVALALHREWPREYPETAFLSYGIISCISIAVVAFFVALAQTLKLLSYIDNDDAFSSHSVRALRKIKRCGFVISAVFALLLPTMYRIANTEDAPGLMVIGLFFVGAPLVVSIFAAVIERVLRSAIALKKENDLTV